MKGLSAKKLPPGWMGKQGRRWLFRQAAGAARIIEVGAWLGRSTKVLAKATPGTVWAVDHWKGTPADPDQHALYAETLATRNPAEEFRRNLRKEIAAMKVIPVQLPSVEAAEVIRDRWGSAFDFVFIDADHSYEGCRADIAAYLPLLRPGGLIAGHDYSDRWPGVKQAVDEEFNGWNEVGPVSIWSIRV